MGAHHFGNLPSLSAVFPFSWICWPAGNRRFGVSGRPWGPPGLPKLTIPGRPKNPERYKNGIERWQEGPSQRLGLYRRDHGKHTPQLGTLIVTSMLNTRHHSSTWNSGGPHMRFPLGGRVPLDLRFRGPLEAKSFVRAPKIDPPAAPGRVFDLKCRSCGCDRRCTPQLGALIVTNMLNKRRQRSTW